MNEGGSPAIRVHSYPGSSQQEALERFASDANDAAQQGYEVLSQTWDEDGSLLVTYRLVRDSRSVGLSVPAGAVVAGGALMVIGSLLPWVTAVGGFGISIQRSGIEGGDGLITIVVGLVIALLGLTMLRGESQPWRVTLVASIIGLALVVIDYFAIENRIREVASDGLVIGSVGIGIWVVGIGALVSAVGSLQVRPDSNC